MLATAVPCEFEDLSSTLPSCSTVAFLTVSATCALYPWGLPSTVNIVFVFSNTSWLTLTPVSTTPMTTGLFLSAPAIQFEIDFFISATSR